MSPRARGSLRTALAPALVTVLALVSPGSTRVAAHEVPVSVTVLAYIRPEGERLRLLLRAPLEAMRDMDWPQHGPGYLDLTRVEPLLRDAVTLWILDYVQLYEGDARLESPEIVAARVSLPADRSFASWVDALGHVTGPPLPATTELPWEQAMLDVLVEYQIGSDSSRFSIRPALAHLGLRTVTVLRFLPPGGGERALRYVGDPGLVRLDPRWHQAALRFVRVGFLHILDGIDHLLFLLGLVIPFRRFRPLVAIVTSFTVAHSITLMTSALGLAPGALWFPPLIETLIAVSILYMAFENIVGARLQRRWLIAFGFGLVHGFGFSFVLRESLQFAGAHLTTSLLAFNLGVELGQLLVVVLAVPLLDRLFRHVMAERLGTILLSALVAHTAWHWMIDRASALRQYDLRWPAFDLGLLASAMRGVMLVLIVLGVVWVLFRLFRRLTQPAPEAQATLSVEP